LAGRCGAPSVVSTATSTAAGHQEAGHGTDREPNDLGIPGASDIEKQSFDFGITTGWIRRSDFSI